MFNEIKAQNCFIFRDSLILGRCRVRVRVELGVSKHFDLLQGVVKALVELQRDNSHELNLNFSMGCGTVSRLRQQWVLSTAVFSSLGCFLLRNNSGHMHIYQSSCNGFSRRSSDLLLRIHKCLLFQPCPAKSNH